MAIRILQIVTYMGRGGLETMLMNYYRHIDRSKVQFDFLVHRNFEADYDKEIMALGGKIFHISRLVPWSRKYKQELIEFFQKHPEYKIVHVHQDCLSSVALKCAKACGIPVRIVHSHNSNQDKNLKYLVKRYYMKFIPDFATDFFACGKAAGDWMFAGHQYQLLPNAIDTHEYSYSREVSEQVRKKLGLEGQVVIGNVGRFNPQKNHLFLIDVFAECVKLNSNVCLLLIGDGEGKDKIWSKVKELNLQDKVIMTGVRKDVNELMQAMNVFVFPSLYEGLPVTMIEAQASGLPCVISANISEECIVTTDLCISLELTLPASEWARVILQKSNSERIDHSQEINASGFDITEATKKLEEFYLQKY